LYKPIKELVVNIEDAKNLLLEELRVDDERVNEGVNEGDDERVEKRVNGGVEKRVNGDIGYLRRLIE
jgi:hypothetical protein